MVPPCSDRISRVPPYSRTAKLSTRTGLSPAMARLSRRFRFLLCSHWPGPRSLATTRGVSIDVLSSGYLDVSVRRVRFLHLWIQYRMTQRVGFPHSEIRGSKVALTSPRLIAECHVLHRLSAPRHSPNALLALVRRNRHTQGKTPGGIRPDRNPKARPRCACRFARLEIVAGRPDRPPEGGLPYRPATASQNLFTMSKSPGSHVPPDICGQISANE
jgi:hypothetical protein